MRGSGFGVALAALLWACAANAQWLHEQGEDDPFAGGAQQLAMAFSATGEMIAFRCTSLDDLSLLFVSIEKPQPGQLELLSALPFKVLVIVDNEPKREFSGSIDATPDGDRYRVTATDPDLADLVNLVAAAKRRLAVAVEMRGQRIYSTAVGVAGSRLATSKLANHCQLP